MSKHWYAVRVCFYTDCEECGGHWEDYAREYEADSAKEAKAQAIAEYGKEAVTGDMSLIPYCYKCKRGVKTDTLLFAIDHKIDGTGHLECICHTVYEYEVKDGKLARFETSEVKA